MRNFLSSVGALFNPFLLRLCEVCLGFVFYPSFSSSQFKSPPDLSAPPAPCPLPPPLRNPRRRRWPKRRCRRPSPPGPRITYLALLCRRQRICETSVLFGRHLFLKQRFLIGNYHTILYLALHIGNRFFISVFMGKKKSRLAIRKHIHIYIYVQVYVLMYIY